MDPVPKLLMIYFILSISFTVYGQVNVTSRNDVISMRDYPFRLTYSPVKLYSLNEKIELRCARDTSVPTNITELLTLKIITKSQNKWKSLAALRVGNNSVKVSNKIAGFGSIKSVNNSYLDVSWEITRESALGFYQCLAFGLDQNAFPIEEKSRKMKPTVPKIPERSILSLISETESEIREDISKTSQLLDEAAEALDEFSVQSDANFSDINDRFGQPEEVLESLMRNVLFPKEENIWPAGSYALLKPDSGCPVDLAFYEGNTGYFKLHTESSSMANNDDYSPNSHLSKPIATSYSVNNFITLRFCVANDIFNTGIWPDGRYCIHKKGRCPDGFKSGYIQPNTEDSGNLDEAGGNIPDRNPQYLEFCCKTTSHTIHPITLPTASPFYLYQYDGRCQEVRGMKVTTEYIQVDTEPGADNKLGGYYPYTINQAGGLLRLELCYYTKL